MQKLPKPSLSCGNSTCPKTPQSGFLEEAKAVPAESIRPDRSRTAAIAHVLANQPAFTSQFIDVVSEPIIFGIEQSFNSLLSICSLIIIHNLAKLSRVETSDRQLNRSFKIKNGLNSN